MFVVNGLHRIHFFNLLQEEDVCLQRYSIQVVVFKNNHFVVLNIVVHDVLHRTHVQSRSERRGPYSDDIPVLPAVVQFRENAFRFTRNTLHRFSFFGAIGPLRIMRKIVYQLKAWATAYGRSKGRCFFKRHNFFLANLQKRRWKVIVWEEEGWTMIFSGETEENLNSAMDNLNMELVTDPGEVLNILTDSKTQGTAVGINAPILGNEIYVTAVEDIIIGQEITIVLKNFDITGYMLETNKLKLGDIQSVCPFKSPFQNPLMRTLKNGKPI